MPVGKYYCDYCDKQFQDTPSSRRRHLQGLQHLRAKALWYDSVPQSSPSLTSDSSGKKTISDGFLKGACNRFLNTGFCPYGDSCKYVHPKNIRDMNTQIPFDNNQQAVSISGNQSAIAGSPLQGAMVRDCVGMIEWRNLPPSLKPPPEGGYPQLTYVDWG